MIFKDALVKTLEDGKWCETDRGYHGSALAKVKCPSRLLEDLDLAMKATLARVRSHQKAINEWLKIGGY
jgi:hypothetical protein